MTQSERKRNLWLIIETCCRNISRGVFDRRRQLKPRNGDYEDFSLRAVPVPGCAAGSQTGGSGQHVLLLLRAKSTWICTFQSITACCHQTYPVWNSVKPIALHVSCINPITMPASISKRNRWWLYSWLLWDAAETFESSLTRGKNTVCEAEMNVSVLLLCSVHQWKCHVKVRVNMLSEMFACFSNLSAEVMVI